MNAVGHQLWPSREREQISGSAITSYKIHGPPIAANHRISKRSQDGRRRFHFLFRIGRCLSCGRNSILVHRLELLLLLEGRIAHHLLDHGWMLHHRLMLLHVGHCHWGEIRYLDLLAWPIARGCLHLISCLLDCSGTANRHLLLLWLIKYHGRRDS